MKFTVWEEFGRWRWKIQTGLSLEEAIYKASFAPENHKRWAEPDEE